MGEGACKRETSPITASLVLFCHWLVPPPQFTNTNSNVPMYIFCYCCYGTKSLLEAGRAKNKNAYLLFGGHEKFLDHHAVPRVGAPVQRVRPIRTEGAEAVVFTVTHSTVGDGDGGMRWKKINACSFKDGRDG